MFGLSLLKFEGFLCLHKNFKGFGLEIFGSLDFRIQAKGFLGILGSAGEDGLLFLLGCFFCITSVMRKDTGAFETVLGFIGLEIDMVMLQRRKGHRRHGFLVLPRSVGLLRGIRLRS